MKWSRPSVHHNEMDPDIFSNGLTKGHDEREVQGSITFHPPEKKGVQGERYNSRDRLGKGYFPSRGNGQKGTGRLQKQETENKKRHYADKEDSLTTNLFTKELIIHLVPFLLFETLKHASPPLSRQRRKSNLSKMGEAVV